MGLLDYGSALLAAASAVLVTANTRVASGFVNRWAWASPPHTFEVKSAVTDRSGGEEGTRTLNPRRAKERPMTVREQESVMAHAE